MPISRDAKFRHLLAEMRTSEPIVAVQPLVPEASARRYYRLQLQSGRTLIGVEEAPATARANMPLVQSIALFLRQHGVAVPLVHIYDAESGVMIQQDLGDLSLNQALRDEPSKWELYYHDAILHMLQWQRLADDGQCPAFKLSFDVEKLMFEFEFFITHTLLGHYRASVPDAELSEIRAAFRKIAEELAAYPNKVFTHRDYHSKNIIVCENHTQCIIDFQDARLGLMQYDLCSLLCDAYAPLPPERRAVLLDFAFEQGKDVHRQARGEFEHYWQLSAFQRTVKAMGTFGRQAALGREDFAAYLEPAWQVLREISADGKNAALQAVTRQLAELMKVRPRRHGEHGAAD